MEKSTVYIFFLRDHACITSIKRWAGVLEKGPMFADKVGGVQKGQKHADVVHGWSLITEKQILNIVNRGR